jgi:putative flippase GtrA
MLAMLAIYHESLVGRAIALNSAIIIAFAANICTTFTGKY